MSFQSDMLAYMQSQTALEAVIDADSDIRFYPASEVPQGVTFPYIAWRKITDAPLHHLTAAVGHSESSYQFDCVGQNLEDAYSASEALRAEMDGYQGTWGSATYVRRCHLISEVQDFIPTGNGSEGGTHVVTQDYEIAYVRSVPTFA